MLSHISKLKILESYFKRKEGKDRERTAKGEKESRRCKGKEKNEKRGESKKRKRQKKRKEKTVWICSLKKNFLVMLRRKKIMLL